MNYMEGSPGLQPDDIHHLLVPGYGRTNNGRTLSVNGQRRIDVAAAFYSDRDLTTSGGIIVASGYKTPRDRAGDPWISPETGHRFLGIPEAYLARTALIGAGINAALIRVEPYSFDTTTNFANTEALKLLPADQPVGIVASVGHLDRIIDGGIARRTLRRDYLGISTEEVDSNSLAADIFSRLVLRPPLPSSPEQVAAATSRRARHLWKVVLMVLRLKNTLPIDHPNHKGDEWHFPALPGAPGAS